MGQRNQRQKSYGSAHAEVCLQPHRRRSGRPAGVRWRGHSAGIRDRRSAGRPRRLPGEAGHGLQEVPLDVLILAGCPALGLRRPER